MLAERTPFTLKNRDSCRFLIAAYVLLVLISLVLSSFIGVYAFGLIRYALFIHTPLLVIAAYGVNDIARLLWNAFHLLTLKYCKQSFVEALKTSLVVFLMISILLVSANVAAYVRAAKDDFSDKFSRALSTVRNDRSPILIYDYFAKLNLEAIGIREFPEKKIFLFDLYFFATQGKSEELFSEYISFLETGEDILSVTYHAPKDEVLFSKYTSEIEKRYTKWDEITLNLWKIGKWKKR